MGLSVGKIKFIFIVAVFLGAFFLVAGTVRATGPQFFVDSDFDAFLREDVTATLYYAGNKAEYYVEDAYLATLGGFARDRLKENIIELSNTFDKDIYHVLTRTFGLEWTPGIDNNPKTTVLLLQIKDEIGGYFLNNNEFLRADVPNSNEREMVYMNVNQFGSEPSDARRVAAFLAHEFQHLINFNQKTRYGAVDDVWFNEMLSEIAPTIAGLDDIYDGSNVEARVARFLQEPDDPLTIWDGRAEDYSSVNLFGQYLFGQYGAEFFTLLSTSSYTGERAINEALTSVGQTKRFSDVFSDWVVATLINNCNTQPMGVFCYNNPNLSADTIRINFNMGLGEGDVISSTDSAFPWQGQWFKYERSLASTRPNNHVFSLDFLGATEAQFFMPYVASGVDGDKLFFLQPDSNQSGTIAIEDFGFEVSSIVIMPVNRTPGSADPASFRITARLTDSVPAGVSPSVATSPASGESSASIMPVADIFDGALIRAEGDDKVYIVKGAYKRWVQAPQIIDFYGHLRWEDIIEVSSAALDNYKSSNVIRFAADKKVYSVSPSGKKTWITSEEQFLGAGYSFDMVYEVNESEFNFYQ